jgi:pilus assembly protein Flp/PilA
MSSTTPSDLYLYLRSLLEREEGQDLVEYALVTSLIGFGAVAGMQNLATSIDTIFDAVTVVLSSNIT